MVDDQGHIVEQQFAVVVKDYPGLALGRNDGGSFTISGKFLFSAEFNGESISDGFDLEVYIPADFPASIPFVKEVGGRIPRDFHTNPDGTLCLNVPIELRKMFRTNGTLYDFMTQSVIHFLYAFCYFEKHGEMPYGEWSHGGKGILEYYRDIFKVKDDALVVGLLRILVDNDYRGHHQCPCGSGLILRECHGSQIRELRGFQTSGQFMYDYVLVLTHILGEAKSIPDTFISKTLKKRLARKHHAS